MGSAQEVPGGHDFWLHYRGIVIKPAFGWSAEHELVLRDSALPP
jgi:hypothetical protein